MCEDPRAQVTALDKLHHVCLKVILKLFSDLDSEESRKIKVGIIQNLAYHGILSKFHLLKGLCEPFESCHVNAIFGITMVCAPVCISLAN